MTSELELTNEVFWTHGAVDWRFFRARDSVSPLEYRHRDFLICVSLKNPRFSNSWINEAVSGACELGRRTIVTLVDSPYFESLGGIELEQSEKQRRFSALRTQRDEQLHRLKRLIKDHEAAAEFTPWDWFQSQTGYDLKEEISVAYGNGGVVTDLINKQVRSIVDMNLDAGEIRHFARFLLEEIPVLVSIYYRILGGCIDVYPGEQASFFWALDKGALAEELPKMSSLAKAGDPHTFAVFYL